MDPVPGSGPSDMRPFVDPVSHESRPARAHVDRAVKIQQAAEEIFSATSQALKERDVAGPTYRLQLNNQFTLIDAQKVVPYLHQLGIKCVYLSPVLSATPGSPHGYDVVNHNRINPELGGPDPLPGEQSPSGRGEIAFSNLMKTLEEFGMIAKLDVVPNHMGVGDRAHQNRWWQSVLKFGRLSPFASAFYIDFDKAKGRVVTPFLGAPLLDVLRDGHFKLRFDTEESRFSVTLYGHTEYPVTPSTYQQILAPNDFSLITLITECRTTNPELDQALGQRSPASPDYMRIATNKDAAVREVVEVLDACQSLPDFTAESYRDEFRDLPQRTRKIEQQIGKLYRSNEGFRRYLDTRIELINGRAGSLVSLAEMKNLLDHQVYKFHHWKMAPGNLNVSRFFDVNTLWALREEEPAVFRAVHARLFRLVAQYPQICGLRIDHPDGLYAPGKYLHDLQEGVFMKIAQAEFRARDVHENTGLTWREVGPAVAEMRSSSADVPLVHVHLEKILGEKELPPSFEDSIGRVPHHGTTGYEYLALLRAVQVDPRGLAEQEVLYTQFTGERLDFDTARKAAKEMIARHTMGDEFDQLARLFIDSFLKDDRGKFKPQYEDVSHPIIKHALETLAVELSVYRTYINENGVTDEDDKILAETFQAARERYDLPSDVYGLLEEFFDTHSEGILPKELNRRLDFVRRWQKFTGPVTAKALEDTLWYRYLQTSFALLEVGSDPNLGAVTPAELHELAEQYHDRYPVTMIAGSTHDTKRDEGVAGRLVAVTWNVSKYGEFLRQLDEHGKMLMENVGCQLKNPEKVRYFTYMTVVGTLPLGFTKSSMDDQADYISRIQGYVEKALKEGKEEVSWIAPNDEKIAGVRAFISSLLSDSRSLRIFEEYVDGISAIGARASIAHLLLRNGGLPGVPDLYQGTEFHTYNLVDPDNRREISFEARTEALNSVQRMWEEPEGREKLLHIARSYPDSDTAKLFFAWKGIQTFNDFHDLFRNGDYRPLSFDGGWASDQENIGFLRSDKNRAVITVVHLRERGTFLGEELVLPDEFVNRKVRNVITGTVHATWSSDRHGVVLPLEALYEGMPGAILEILDDSSEEAQPPDQQN